MLIPPVPNFGTLFARAQEGWFGRYEDVKDFLQTMNIKVSIKKNDEPLSPIGGSFWMNTRALNNRFDVNCLSDIEDEQKMLLILPFLVQNAGYYTGIAYNMDLQLQ